MRITTSNLTHPDIRPLAESGDKRYILNEAYKFALIVDGVKLSFTIPKGFKYDGASVPRFVMFVSGFERDGVHRASALIHDFMYVKNGAMMDDVGNVFIYKRKHADKVFLKGMKQQGIKSWHAQFAYVMTRSFGWIYRSF